MLTLNTGATDMEIKAAIKTVRSDIEFLQERIETINLAPVGCHGALQFFKQRLAAQQSTLNWLVNFE